jgi:hypothetical protein
MVFLVLIIIIINNIIPTFSIFLEKKVYFIFYNDNFHSQGTCRKRATKKENVGKMSVKHVSNHAAKLQIKFFVLIFL